jgi:hypothetical protein
MCPYIGDWHRGKRHGEGLMYYAADYSVMYKGGWVKGLREVCVYIYI